MCEDGVNPRPSQCKVPVKVLADERLELEKQAGLESQENAALPAPLEDWSFFLESPRWRSIRPTWTSHSTVSVSAAVPMMVLLHCIHLCLLLWSQGLEERSFSFGMSGHHL